MTTPRASMVGYSRLDGTGSSASQRVWVRRFCRFGVVGLVVALAVVSCVLWRLGDPPVDYGVDVCKEMRAGEVGMSGSTATVVSAYLARPGEEAVTEDLREFAEYFMSLNVPMVLFVDEVGRNFTREHRTADLAQRTRIVETNWSSLWVSKYDWKEQRKKDWNFMLRRPETYKFRNEKTSFLYRASLLDPFHTTHFYWVDMDTFRYSPSPDSLGIQWPSPNVTGRFPKILLLQLSPFRLRETLLSFEQLRNVFFGTSRLDSTIFGGSKEYISKWNTAYYRVLDRFFTRHQFAGSDIAVMAATSIIFPDIVLRVPSRSPNPKSRWSYMISFLKGEFHCDVAVDWPKPV